MVHHNPILPAPLKKGSIIGIAAPAGKIKNQSNFSQGIRILHEMGFITKFPRDLWPGQDYLADSDKNRSLEFGALWGDNEIDAIMAARGGYGSLRIIENLLVDCSVNDAKLFIGFSDVSIIHDQLNRRLKCASLLGPVVTSLAHMAEDNLRRFQQVLTTGLSQWKYNESIDILRGKGRLSGVSCGGNLSTLISTLGTQYEPDWDGKIVFLEDNCEPAYRIDRMFTQLKLSGILNQPKAIILGDFSYGLNLDRVGVMRHHEAIWQRVCDLTDESISIWGNFPIGHGSTNYPVPLGASMIVDNSSATLVCNA